MEKVRLGDVFTISSGGTPNKKNDNYYKGGNIPWIKTGDLKNRYVCDEVEYITEEGLKNSSAKLFPKDTVLVAMYGATIGACSILPYEASTNQACAAFLPNDMILPDYLYYFLCSQKEKFIKDGVGGAQPNISAGYLKNVLLQFRNLSEQKDIINKLNHVIDMIERRKQQLEKLDELVKARFVELFGTIHDNKFGYEIKTLQDVCEQIKDGTHQTPTYTDDRVNGYKFLSSKDVTTGKIDWTHLKYIPEELHNELYARIAPRKGDVLLAKNGTTGIAAIVDREEIFDIYVSLALLRPIEINSVYLWAAINSVETKQQFDASLKGIGVPNLHLGEIKKARIIVPPVEEQNQFATFVKQTDKSKSEVQNSLEKLELLKKALMQKYFG